MPSVGVQLYSVVFKLILKHRLQQHTQNSLSSQGESNRLTRSSSSRSKANTIPASAAFIDGVATKDINIDPSTLLSLRIFLPEPELAVAALPQGQQRDSRDVDLTLRAWGLAQRETIHEVDSAQSSRKLNRNASTNAKGVSYESSSTHRRKSYGGIVDNMRSSYGGIGDKQQRVCQDSLLRQGMDEDVNPSEKDSLLRCTDKTSGSGQINDKDQRDTFGGKTRNMGNYKGYLPTYSSPYQRKLPIILQFHGGGFVYGSKDSAANDIFCRRMAKLCNAIVIAVGFRLAPENRYPAAFDDAFEALCWLGKQANLAECSKSLGLISKGVLRDGVDVRRADWRREIVDSFGDSMVEPWLAAHGDHSRCVLVGVSSGANIADHVARKAVQAGNRLEPVKVVAQVLMYPFFIGSVPTQSEIKLANSYFYDKATCILAWKLFLPDEEFSLDHVAANPLIPGTDPPLKLMPPTLTVVAELDWMKDRAIAYSEALKKANIDAPVLEYKDAVHEFATLDILIKSRQAEACTEDMAIWIKKYISYKGHEISY